MFTGNSQRGLVLARLPVPRPRAGEHTVACPRCDMVLADGAAYLCCPVCDVEVDWVDLQRPVWACPSCAGMCNGEVEAPPWCDGCRRAFVGIHDPGSFEKRHALDRPEALESIRDAVEGPSGWRWRWRWGSGSPSSCRWGRIPAGA